MRILHYTLGLAPQRSGGLTLYSTDLMREQSKQHNVMLLYPSQYRWWSSQIKWKQKSDSVVALINALPVPLLYGVSNPKDFIASSVMDIKQMESLYDATKPDVFHVHTLMGLPKELLVYFKEKGVKLVFTTHDYFGICPRVNMIDLCGEVCTSPSAAKCMAGNIESKSTLFLRFRNSRFVLTLKNLTFIKWIYDKRSRL